MLHSRALRSLALLSALCTASAFGANVEVGELTVQDVATQVVPHGLGETPKFLYLWTSGAQSADTLEPRLRYSQGLADGVSNRAVSSTVSAGQLVTTLSYRRQADAVVSVLNENNTVLAEADLASWNATSFTLAWTTRTAVPLRLHYVLVSGPEVQAKLVPWAMPEDAGTVAQVNGFGFQPELLWSIYSGGTTTPTLPAGGVSTHSRLSFVHGGNQVTSGIWTDDNLPVDSGTQTHNQFWDEMVVIDQSGTPYKRATWNAMSADGFTATFTNATTGAGNVYTLGVRGLNARLTRFTKSVAAAPVTQTLGVGFTPQAALVTSVNDIARTTPGHGMQWSIGATAHGTQTSSVVLEPRNAIPSTAWCRTSSAAVLMKMTRDSGVLDAVAAVAVVDGGLSFDLPLNDAVATEVIVLALGLFDAGVDAGMDAGLDAGVDAGPDAGVDAGLDAGAPDGAVAMDAGVADAGPLDAGPSDGGTEPPPAPLALDVGCGCGATPGAGVLLGLGLAFALRRRRPHVSPNC